MECPVQLLDLSSSEQSSSQVTYLSVPRSLPDPDSQRECLQSGNLFSMLQSRSSQQLAIVDVEQFGKMTTIDLKDLSAIVSSMDWIVLVELIQEIITVKAVETKEQMQLIGDAMRRFQPLPLSWWKLTVFGEIIHRVPVDLGQFLAVGCGSIMSLLEMLLMNKELQQLKTILTETRMSLVKRNFCVKCSSYKLPNDWNKFEEDHRDLPYSNGCVTRLLLIYAELSLKTRVTKIRFGNRNVERHSFVGFHIPRDVPQKIDWVPDEDAILCMCCKRIKFTATRRKHHCRRCGRVICYSCSRHRKKIPNSFKNRPVRHCDDCWKWSNDQTNRRNPVGTSSSSTDDADSDDTKTLWRLTGHDDHKDSLVRLQFSYDCTPNVELCLGILNLLCPADDEVCNEFFIRQCKKFEDLIRLSGDRHRRSERPRDNCRKLTNVLQGLAWAAKVRGGGLNWDLMLAKAQLMKKLAHLDLESLIPVGNDDQLSTTECLRKIRDNLMGAGLFAMAFDATLMSGLPTQPVLLAWGLQCLQLGHLSLARDKLLQSLGGGVLSCTIAKRISLALIDGQYAPELTEVVVRPKTTPHPVLEILKVIAEKYDVDESYFYLFLYASHRDILSFLMARNRLSLAFRYIIDQRLDFEDFLECVVLNATVEIGEFEMIVLMRGTNPSLERWEIYLRKLCCLYEKKNLLVNLFNCQAALGDDVRAALTCIKFYCNNCPNYKSFLEHLHYLDNAEFHFKRDLKKKHHINYKATTNPNRSCKLILDQKKIHLHLRMIFLQKKITRFLVPFEDTTNKLLDIVERCSGNTIDTPLTIFDQQHLRHLMFLLVSCDISRGYELICEIISCLPSSSTDRRYVFQFIIDQFAENNSFDEVVAFTKLVRTRGGGVRLMDRCIYTTVTACRGDRKFLLKLVQRIENIHMR